jgi:hypothetical protein
MGMVWFGMAWHGMVWFDTVWYGMLWDGMDCFVFYVIVCFFVVNSM